MKKLLTIFFLFQLSIVKAQFGFDVPGQFVMDFGLLRYTEVPNGMDIKTWGSRGVNVYYFADFELGNEKWTFNPGFGLGLDKYSFIEDITVGKAIANATNEEVLARINLPANVDVRKTLLATEYFDIPIEFRFRTARGRNAFRMGIGGRVGVLFKSKTKVKFEDSLGVVQIDKDIEDFLVSPFRYGLTARMGFKSFNVFAYYNLNELFKENVLQNIDNSVTVNSFMVGITLTAL